MRAVKLLVLIVFLPFTGLQAQKIEKQFQLLLDSIFDANPQAIGILAHVESPTNKISWSGAAGNFQKGSSIPLQPEQTAMIASNTKTYVSAAILQLQTQKKLTIHQSVTTFLSAKTLDLFDKQGYPLDSIKIENLMSHTSGIRNFANQAYFDTIISNPKHRWTRDEQLEWAVNAGPPLSFPGTHFKYADTNYLLLTEIIEQVTDKPFYTAMRDLLQYEANGLHDTWFPTLEERPKHALPRAHQYDDKMNINSYDLDVSVDLYGGGGIACSTRNLALFNYKLFNGEIVKDNAVLNLIYTEFPTKDEKQSHYHLGISEYNFEGYRAYGHGGFWGTKLMYFPDLDTSIAIFILERNEREVQNEVLQSLLRHLE